LESRVAETLSVTLKEVKIMYKYLFGPVPSRRLGISLGVDLVPKKVRDELMNANVVLPSLDAATKITFQKINRPAPQLTVEKNIQGLIDFRNEFSGQLWLEVFIVPGYNDNKDGLKALKKAFTGKRRVLSN